jgi:hypothetical protein
MGRERRSAGRLAKISLSSSRFKARPSVWRETAHIGIKTAGFSSQCLLFGTGTPSTVNQRNQEKSVHGSFETLEQTGRLPDTGLATRSEATFYRAKRTGGGGFSRLKTGRHSKSKQSIQLDERSPAQYELDFRTGRPTAITGPVVTSGERAACSATNARRTRGILQVSQLSPSRQSLPPDVWAAAFIRKTRDRDVPLVAC